MRTRAAVQYRQQLDNLFARVKDVEDLELKAHWARYLCVLCCGFLEVSVKAVLVSYARGKANPVVANFVEQQLGQFRNPKMKNIDDLLRRFSQEWADAVAARTGDEVKDSVDSLTANRHQIAHGVNTGISFLRVREWHKRSIQFIEILEAVCLS